MGSHQEFDGSIISNADVEYGGSISSNTNVKSLYERRPNQDIYNHITSSSQEQCAPPPLPPTERGSSNGTNQDEISESLPPEYKQKSCNLALSDWCRKVIIGILVLNTVLMIGIGAIAVTALYEIKELKKNDQVRAHSISEHCVRLHVLELLVSDFKLFTTGQVLNTSEVEESGKSKIHLENEINILQAEIQNLLEANKTCNDELRNVEIPTEPTKICPGQVEMNNLNNQVQDLLEANRTCSDALKKQHNANNCSSTQDEKLQIEIADIRNASAKCSIELKNLKDDIPPCLVVTTTISPDAIDIYNWVTAPNGLEYKISGEVNFFEANTTCNSKGAQLAISGTRDPSTREFLADNLISARGVNVWIGLTDLEEESTWMWQDGVLATAFNTNWGSRQPSNSYGGQHCAVLHASQLMYDEWCTGNARALCEREPNST